jgi:hypothetical protein
MTEQTGDEPVRTMAGETAALLRRLKEAENALAAAGFERTGKGWEPVRDTSRRPVILATNAELFGILQGDSHGLANLDGSVAVTVRMYTPEELIQAQAASDRRLAEQLPGRPMVGPLPYAQAVVLTRVLPADLRRGLGGSWS